MKNVFRLLSITAFLLVIAFAMVSCEGEDDGGKKSGEIEVPPPTPLTGTVSVASNVTVDSTNGAETKTLTANVSGSNASAFSYQWIKDGNLIGSSSTYNVTTSDYDKTLTVKVTGSGNYSGTLSGTIAVGSPTTCKVSVKYDPSTSYNSTYYAQVRFEREDGTRLGLTSASLGMTAETVSLTSWTATKFKINIKNSTTNNYFKNNTLSGGETFDLTTGTKSYNLKFDNYSVGYYLNAVAVLQ